MISVEIGTLSSFILMLCISEVKNFFEYLVFVVSEENSSYFSLKYVFKAKANNYMNNESHVLHVFHIFLDIMKPYFHSSYEI